MTATKGSVDRCGSFLDSLDGLALFWLCEGTAVEDVIKALACTNGRESTDWERRCLRVLRHVELCPG